ncbi:N-acetylmuramic acid 6-phosphate etherase [Bryobacter aggregatus]|uniref:N-acetylmuramic acid 6-phosphate etherase n=1 Tax=Bryobacter aggregatus TaxID=360054 RepID=UPI0004E24E93|nr:N-acetylmuramic acid 6-phosphate etherase [Bryobacter aggregatus]
MKFETLLTEQANPASAHIDRVDTLEMVRIINEEDKKVALAVEAALPQIAAAIDAIVPRMRAGGRLFYTGAGTSGRLGVLDASECPPTYDVSPELVQGLIAGGDTALRKAVEGAEDSRELGAQELLATGFHSQDTLCGIAASGRTPYVLGAMAAARELGALTLALSCSPNSPLSQAAEIAIEVLPGPEVVTGSTRMKAGTATKLVLNMLSTGVLIRLGYVFGNLMVNVQPTNEKLVNRALRIIMQATGTDRDAAEKLFEESGRVVRTAIVMGRLKVTRAEAESRLARAGNRVADALL